MNWGEFVRLSRERLPSEYEEEERIAVIERLIEGRCGMRRIDLVIRRADVIEAEAETRLMDDLARLERGEPVQYVLGRAPFMGMNLQVSPAVLIPRQETEEVVRQAMDKVRSWMARYPGTRLRILDVGTGSGCIAISLAKAFPDGEVIGIDISDAALEIARRNSSEQDAAVHFLQADVLQETQLSEMPFHLIVSNPPYIPQADEATLHSRVRDHEPPQALFSPTEDPLLYYRVIAERASRWLVPGGWLIFEIHSGTGSETEDLLKTAGLVDTSHLRDLNGNERIVLGRLPDDVAGPGK